jgi:serine/threonine protein phosphatase PrpC/type II secretory pathway pseudopilin PulG
MTRLKTSSAQFGLIGGICRASSDCILVQEPSPLSPDARWKGNLYLLAEPASEGGRNAPLVRQVLTEIAQAYYACTSPSITTCLGRAINQAGRSLFQRNMQVSGHEKVTVGVTCAVVRGDELFLAQVLPGQAYVAHQGRLQAFPRSPSWDPEAATLPLTTHLAALGWGEEASPEFFHFPLTPGDVFCLCSSQIGRLLGREEAEQVLLYQDAPSAVEQLYRRVHQQGFGEAHALVVEMQTAVSREGASLFSWAGLQERGRLVGETLATWGGFLGGEVRRLFQRPQPPAEVVVPRRPKAPPPPEPTRPPEMPELARPRPRKSLRQKAYDLLHPQMAFPRLQRSRLRIRPARRPRKPLPWALALVALLVLALIIFLIVQEDRARRQAEFRAQLHAAQSLIEEALQIADLPQANAKLREAEQTLHGMLDPQHPDPEVQLTLDRLQEERDRLNHVFRFPQLDLLIDLSTFTRTMAAESFSGACTETCTFRDLVLVDDTLYLLEGTRGTVYQYASRQVNPALIPVLWPGMPNLGRPVSPILDIALLKRPQDCQPDSSTSDWLAALDAGGVLYLYRPGQWEFYTLTLSLTENVSWADSPTDMEGFQGNLYVLKSRMGRLLKYYCAFYEEWGPESWLLDPRNVRLSEAVDMVVDGSIYLLLSDGTVQRLYNRKYDRAISIQGMLYPAELAPAQVFTENWDDPYLYLVDRSLGRVLQLRKEGRPALVRDLRGPHDEDLRGLRAVVVVAEDHLMYLVAGSKLYRAALPEPTPPATPPPAATPTP